MNSMLLFLMLIGALTCGTNSPCVPFLLVSPSHSLEHCLGALVQLPNGCLLSKKSASKGLYLPLPASGGEWHQFWEGAGDCDRSLCAVPESLESISGALLILPLLLLSPSCAYLQELLGALVLDAHEEPVAGLLFIQRS